MKKIITQDQFEDVLYNPSLVVVQKEHTFGKDVHLTTLHVFEDEFSEMPVRTLTREITAVGVTFEEETK